MTKKKQVLIICIALTVVTFIAFWQVGNADYINFDDNVYVTENTNIQNGITIEGIRWAFTTNYACFWHPLTWISYMLDVQLYGLKPGWHHLTNLIFHILNTLLLFLVINRMTKTLWQSAFVAALFAIHPLHVESVAWVAERKDVLSTFFWMLTMGGYIYYVENPTLQRYLAVLIFFVFGLMAKPMLVTLPFALFLMDYWPLKRFGQINTDQKIRAKVVNPLSMDNRKSKTRKKDIVKEAAQAGKSVDYKYQWTLIRPLLWEKIPLFVLAVLFSIVAYIAQMEGGAIRSIEEYTLGVRIENAFVSYIIYIGKMIWPSNLTVYYPHPGQLPLWEIFGAVFLLIVGTFAVIRAAKMFPYLIVGWFWYIGILVPVIGIVQVGSQARADRYTYIPLIGLFIIVAWGIPELLKKWHYHERILFAASVLILSCFFMITWIQVGYWHDSFQLFEHALKVSNRNILAYYSLGCAYEKLGHYKQAIDNYNSAIELNPIARTDSYYNRGNVYYRLGDYKRAIKDYEQAIKIKPKDAKCYHNRGVANTILGNFKQAIEDFDRAIEINPKFTEAYYNRGTAYNLMGDYNRAIEDFHRAIEINPAYETAYNNIRDAYSHHVTDRQGTSPGSTDSGSPMSSR